MNRDEYLKMRELEDHYWWFVARRRLALRLLRSHVATENPKILDLGCGTGAVLAELIQWSQATGLDFSDLAIQMCKERGLDHLVEGDAQALPFADCEFDAIVALDIFEHVSDDVKAFSEAARVLKPGGKLVLSVPAYRWLWGPHDIALHHFRRYTRSQVRRVLEQAGLESTISGYSVFLLFPFVALSRPLEKLKRGPAKASLPHLPKSVNNLLVKVMHWEQSLVSSGKAPWGSSVIAVATKPVD